MPRRSPPPATPADATLPTREQLRAFIAASPGRVGKREIAREFNIPVHLKHELRTLLASLAEQGAIAPAGHKRFTPPAASPRPPSSASPAPTPTASPSPAPSTGPTTAPHPSSSCTPSAAASPPSPPANASSPTSAPSATAPLERKGTKAAPSSA